MPPVLSPEDRSRLREAVLSQLDHLDDATLQTLAQHLENRSVISSPATSSGVVTRRRFLAGMLGAGLVGAGLGGGGGLVHGTTRAWEEANRQIETWRGLVSLYEELDNVGVDTVVQQGMEELGNLVAALRPLVPQVRAGVEWAQAFVEEVDQALAVVDRGLAALETIVSRLADSLESLERSLAEAGERTGPLGKRVGGFFRALLERLPFGLGDRLLAVLDRIQATLSALPESVAAINTEVIEPLRRRYFPREGENVRVRLTDTLATSLFDPLLALLDHTEQLLTRWEEALAAPATERLAKLEQARRAVFAYRRAQGLETPAEEP